MVDGVLSYLILSYLHNNPEVHDCGSTDAGLVEITGSTLQKRNKLRDAGVN